MYVSWWLQLLDKNSIILPCAANISIDFTNKCLFCCCINWPITRWNICLCWGLCYWLYTSNSSEVLIQAVCCIAPAILPHRLGVNYDLLTKVTIPKQFLYKFISPVLNLFEYFLYNLTIYLLCIPNRHGYLHIYYIVLYMHCPLGRPIWDTGFKYHVKN
jgi:hypothetical protein